MSHALLSMKHTAAPAAKAKSVPEPASMNLRVGKPDDVFEREADRATDEVTAPGALHNLGWSLSKMNTDAPLQRKCACGGMARPSGECEACKKKKRLGLQAKLKVDEPGDIYEKEADRIADQVLAAPAHPAFSGAPPRIHRFTGQANAEADTAPASVDHVLDSPGSPLSSALRQDMEQRFGHDFSRVRVHTGAAAQRSASEVNANAYTSGYDIVFEAGLFAPETGQGRRLIAHELTHVVQQSDAARIGRAWTAIQRDKSHKAEKTKEADDFTVELDHGSRGRFLIHFDKPHSLDEVLGLLFAGGALPQGYKLEDKGIDLLGWTWGFTTAKGVIDIGTFQKLTPAFQKHLSPGTLSLTEEESASIHARHEEFMDSREPYLPGQSVREAFQECRDHQVPAEVTEEGRKAALIPQGLSPKPSPGCWGKRAGFFYYVGWQEGFGTQLQAKSAPTSEHISKDWEWWLNQGFSLSDTDRQEDALQNWVLQQAVFSFANALSSAPGSLRRPQVPASTVAKVGMVVGTAAQFYAALKAALGEEVTPFDLYLMAFGGAIEAAASSLDNELGALGRSFRRGSPEPSEPATLPVKTPPAGTTEALETPKPVIRTKGEETHTIVRKTEKDPTGIKGSKKKVPAKKIGKQETEATAPKVAGKKGGKLEDPKGAPTPTPTEATAPKVAGKKGGKLEDPKGAPTPTPAPATTKAPPTTVAKAPAAPGGAATVVHQYIRNPNIRVGSGEPWTGTGPEPQWANPKSAKAYDHIESTHGPKVKPHQFKGRMGSTNDPQGQWHKAEDWVLAEQVAPKNPGDYVIDFGRPVGRVYIPPTVENPDGSIVENVTRAFVQRLPDGTLNSAYPVTNNFSLRGPRSPTPTGGPTSGSTSGSGPPIK